MTFTEKFNSLKKTYKKSADLTKLTESFAAQIEMTDDDCHGIFYIAYLNGALSIEPYDYHDNTVSVSVNSADLEKMLNDTLNPVDAYNNGILTVNGNIGHALMLIDALKITKAAPKKAAAEKKPAKKAPAKKEAATETKTTSCAKRAACKKTAPEAKKTEKKAESSKKASTKTKETK